LLLLSCLRHQIQGNQVMAALVVNAQLSRQAWTWEITLWCNTNTNTNTATSTVAVGMLLYTIFGCLKCWGKKLEKKYSRPPRGLGELKRVLCGAWEMTHDTFGHCLSKNPNIWLHITQNGISQEPHRSKEGKKVQWQGPSGYYYKA
jgi:hypothetical protein